MTAADTIADQIINAILSARPSADTYRLYQLAREEAKAVDPLGSAADPNLPAEASGFEFFLSRWIALEAGLSELLRTYPERRLGESGRVPTMNDLRRLDVFDESEVRAYEGLRRLRNSLIHGKEIPSEQTLRNLGLEVESLLDSLRNQDVVTRDVIDQTLAQFRNPFLTVEGVDFASELRRVVDDMRTTNRAMLRIQPGKDDAGPWIRSIFDEEPGISIASVAVDIRNDGNALARDVRLGVEHQDRSFFAEGPKSISPGSQESQYRFSIRLPHIVLEPTEDNLSANVLDSGVIRLNLSYADASGEEKMLHSCYRFIQDELQYWRSLEVDPCPGR